MTPANNTNIDTRILDGLLQDTQEGLYSDKLKEDVGRVVNCLKFIKINLDFIAFFIEHRANLCQQRNDPGYDLSVRYFLSVLSTSSLQTKKVVLFTIFGTSMHFNNSYSNPLEAREALWLNVQEFEDHAICMREKGHLDLFIRYIEYDKVGCIEARTSRSMATARTVRKTGFLTLEALLESFANTGIFNNPAISDAEKRQKAQAFVEPFLFRNNPVPIAISAPTANVLDLPSSIQTLNFLKRILIATSKRY